MIRPRKRAVTAIPAGLADRGPIAATAQARLPFSVNRLLPQRLRVITVAADSVAALHRAAVGSAAVPPRAAARMAMAEVVDLTAVAADLTAAAATRQTRTHNDLPSAR